LPVKINILWLTDHVGSSTVKRSIDLQLICELPLILGIWLKFLLQLSADAANKRVYMLFTRRVA